VKRRLALGAALGCAMVAARAGAQESPPPAPLGTVTAGPWTLTPVVEVRVRGEYRHDLDAYATDDRGLLVERARLGLDASDDALQARVVLQDARALDLTPSAPVITGPAPVALTGAYEAWGEAHTPGLYPSFVRIGRQPVSWGEGRLLGIADESPAGRSLDAVRGRLAIGAVSVEALAAVLTDPSAGATIDAYGELLGARLEWAFDPLFKLEAYALARFAQANPIDSFEGSVLGETYTGSLRAFGDSYAWTWGVEGAGQLGRAQALGEDRAAWAAAGHVARVFDRGMFTPSVRVGGAFASGSGSGTTYGTFDPILPDVSTWHGAMDAFAWSNEAEADARATATPSSQTGLALEYRYARLVQAGGPWRTDYLTTIGSASGNRSAELGHEIDAAFTWSPWPPVDLRMGYSVLLLGAGARAVLQAEASAMTASALSSVGSGGPHVSQFAYAQAGLALY